MFLRPPVSCFFVFVVGLGASPALGNIVVDGDFEERPLNDPSYDRLSAPSNLGGWVVESGSVDQIGTFWAAASGGSSVDLSGADDATANGVIYQDLATVAEAHYDLTFSLAGSPPPHSGGVKQVEVFWDGVSIGVFSFDSSSRSVSDMGWIDVSVFQLVATGPVTRLQFANVDVGTPGYGAALDDVRVVPEPGSLLVPASALTAIHALRRRRKSRVDDIRV